MELKKLRIGILANCIEVPPLSYGWIERVIFHTVETLNWLGYDVVLFAPKWSKVSCKLVEVSWWNDETDVFYEAFKKENEIKPFDILHDFNASGYKNPERFKHNYCCTIISSGYWTGVVNEPNPIFQSQAQLNWAREFIKDLDAPVVYNWLDNEKIVYNENKDDYFLYLGRYDWQKVPHIAIEAVKKAWVPLVMCWYNADDKYYKEKVEPFFDWKQIINLGAVSEDIQSRLLSEAKALLFPSNWRECLAIVLLQALASWTPIIAETFDWKNCIPEVIENWKEGFIVKWSYEMAEAINNIDKIKHMDCRVKADSLFTRQKMVEGYLKIYYILLENKKTS